MKTRKYLSLALFVFSSMFFQFCNQQCGNKPVQRMAVDNYFYSKTYKRDNLGNVMVQKDDSINMASGDTVYLILNPHTRAAGLMKPSFGNGGLYACDPVGPTYELLGDSMKITTVDDFDGTHPAGSNVNDLFLLYNEYAIIPTEKFQPMSSYRNVRSYHMPLVLALIKKPNVRNVTFRFNFYSGNSSSLASSDAPLMKFY